MNDCHLQCQCCITGHEQTQLRIPWWCMMVIWMSLDQWGRTLSALSCKSYLSQSCTPPIKRVQVTSQVATVWDTMKSKTSLTFSATSTLLGTRASRFKTAVAKPGFLCLSVRDKGPFGNCAQCTKVAILQDRRNKDWWLNYLPSGYLT